MAVLALGSVRSCAVTTLVLSVAATWPEARRVLVVEADPAGGTLGAGAGWPAEPSLVSLAAAARRGGDPGLVLEHCQQLPGGAAVLAGPASAEQARSAIGMLGPLLGRLGELGGDVLVDCGRLDQGSPVLGLWEGADRAVLVARPRLADLQALSSWLEARTFAGRVGVVTMGDGPYPDGEIAEALGVEVLARLPWEPDAAEALVGLPASARQLRVAPLVRAARTLADQLAHGSATHEEETTTVPAGGDRRTAIGRADRAVAVGRRVLAGWRADARSGSADASSNGPPANGASANGKVPEEAGR